MTIPDQASKTKTTPEPESAKDQPEPSQSEDKEIGGPKGPEPTRFGDWEQKGRCSDF